MNFLAFFEKSDIIQDFFSKFQSTQTKKIAKYLLIISIDYLNKYFRNQPIQFENISDLASLFTIIPKIFFICHNIKGIIKTKRKKQTTSTKALTSELIDIKTQISKLKMFCSEESKTPKSTSNRKKNSPKQKKALTLEELNCNSIIKTNKTPKDITPKVNI